MLSRLDLAVYTRIRCMDPAFTLIFCAFNMKLSFFVHKKTAFFLRKAACNRGDYINFTITLAA